MKFDNVKYLGIVSAAALAITGCGQSIQPENTIALNFTIDASGRPDFYADEDLEWKGSFSYDKETRILTYSSDWAGGTGPYAPLYDDGPWTAGGHEPEGATAGDDKFGITAFIAIPEEELKLEYGAQTKAGGWVWVGDNGSVMVPTKAGEAITAEGLKLSPEGTNDLRLTLDTAALEGDYVVAEPIKVKGTFSDWAEEAAFDDGTHGDADAGDGIYTYTLSENATRRLKLTSGTAAEFIWVLGTVEYKTSEGEGAQGGVEAFTKGATGDFTAATITIAGNKNTQVVIP